MIGLLILLPVFALATFIVMQAGAWPGRFIFYAGSALFVQCLSGTVRSS